MAGVGMTRRKVPVAPKPWSSVMMRRTFGAPLGGTTRGAHQDFDSDALSLISPPNFGGGGGSCFPSIVVVAPGVPGTPVACWPNAATQPKARTVTVATMLRQTFMTEAPDALAC